ncbi:DedA family protein [Streptomyces sulfonofaciens]|uniref:DedA family protein n=1 Tax=Streptomyces sulfonofaciens TaxID=68272 RepID=UPI001E39F200|nr:DedA family protein [Streptomyces sulfonofaciens]
MHALTPFFEEMAMAGMPPLPGVLADLAPLLDHWGYLAVGALVGVEDFGIPLPGETVMIVAAVYAGAGRLNVFGVAAVAWLAAVVGDNIGYLIGRTAGRRLVARYGRYVFLPPRRVAKAEGFFTRHGGKVIVVARFIEGLREANGLIAGIARMPWPRFLAYNALGAVLWVATWVSLGYLAGQHISALYPAIQQSEVWLLTATAVVVAALLARRILRHRRASRAEREDGDLDEGAAGRAAGDGTGEEGGGREHGEDGAGRDDSRGRRADGPDGRDRDRGGGRPDDRANRGKDDEADQDADDGADGDEDDGG